MQAAHELPHAEEAERPGRHLGGLAETLEVPVAASVADGLGNATGRGEPEGGVKLAGGARVHVRGKRDALDAGPLVGAGEGARAH